MDQKLSYEDLLSSIRERAIEFDDHLGRVKRVNQELMCKSEKAISTLKELLGTVRNKPTKTCPVCYTRDLSTCLVPCGHIFCLNCAESEAKDTPSLFYMPGTNHRHPQGLCVDENNIQTPAVHTFSVSKQTSGLLPHRTQLLI